MTRCVLALLVALMLCGAATAGEPLGSHELSVQADTPAYGVNYTQERLVRLPQDANKPYLTIFGNASDPEFKKLQNWFAKDKDLAAFKNQCHFNVVATNTEMWRDRYSKTVDPKSLPMVRLQSHRTPIAEFKGREIPFTPDALFHGLNSKAGNAECFRLRRQHEEQVAPVEPDNTDPEPQPLPPDTKPAEPTDSFPVGVLVILTIFGTALGLVSKLHELTGAHHRFKKK